MFACCRRMVSRLVVLAGIGSPKKSSPFGMPCHLCPPPARVAACRPVSPVHTYAIPSVHCLAVGRIYHVAPYVFAL